MQMNVTAGTPAYYALQLSGQTTTNWLPFTTPNLASNLGATDGVYVVSVGLRGLPADAAETWASIAFTRDTTPPIVTLTNLASLTGSRPFIDPAGFVPKALSSLRYTVVDANGVTNSRSGCVTAQGLSLNDPYHVANSFQCVDLALALGVNQISIQAVDWAGNVAMTNFAYVFDTNGDITPPAINVTWPPSGTLISGDSFTVQGNLDDDTATASLQYLDTNGILQTINGLVERGGNLWVQNVPLVAGTNNFTVTATDAAGNMSTNNINVVQSSLSLVITPLTTEAMNCGYAMVTGTVDDPDATIIVNGIPGTNYYGNWEVDNVPLPPGGTVTLLATVQPLEGPATEIDLEQDRKSVVFTQTYGNNLNGSEDGNGSAYGSHGHFEEQGKLEWARGVGGTNWGTAYSTNYDTGESSYDETVTIWPADKGYLPTLKGIQIISGFWIPASYGLPETVYQYTNEVDPPTVEWMEKAEVSMNGCFRDSFGNSVGSYGFSVASCRTVGLFTGSKALRQGQSLFDLNTTLVEKSGLTINPSHPLNVGWGGMPGTSLLGETIRDVPPDRIFLDAVGRLGSDGQLWTVQPRDLEIAITPIVAGGSAEGVSAAFKVSTNPPTTSDASRTPINGALPGAPDFELTIKANSITLSKHVVAAGADFCVGQKVQFELSAFPDGVTATNFQWVLDGSFVNDHAQSNSDSSDNYFENRDLLSNPIITNCWWVSGGFNPPSTYNAKYSCTLLFTNGNPSQSNSATGLFNMYKPEGKITTKTTSVGIYPYQNSWQGIFFNSYSGPGIIFSNSISYGLGFPDSGIVEWVQVDFSPVIKLLTTNSILHTNLQSGFGPYGDEPIPYNTFLPGTFVPVDTPAIKLPNGNEYERGEGSAVFEMWMMFHPGGGIAVPLRAVIWSWSGSATNSIDPVLGWNTWSLEHGTNSIDPPDFPTESFPIWNSHVANFQMNPAVNYR